jgi:hypothetical protein
MSDESKWCGHVPGRPKSGAEQPAENYDSQARLEKNPSGAKARDCFVAFTARLKSCPDTKRPFETASASFSAACKARVDFAAFAAVRAKALTYQSCPFKTMSSSADTKHVL